MHMNQQYNNGHYEHNMGPMQPYQNYQDYQPPHGGHHNSISMSNQSNSFDQSTGGDPRNQNVHGEASQPRSPLNEQDANARGLQMLKQSSLDREVITLTVEQFQSDPDLELSYIEPPSLRLLQEISTLEQKAAVREFVERFKKAKHKIKKSRPGYFRGVCQKYWKQNRERKKCELLRRANVEAKKGYRKERGRISPLIAEAIELLFTPASGLETKIIDESIERRLTQLSDQQGIQALYEFCSAVMYRQERIRNMNAYLMNIITRQMEKSGQRRGQFNQNGNKRPSSRGSNDQGTDNASPRDRDFDDGQGGGYSPQQGNDNRYDDQYGNDNGYPSQQDANGNLDPNDQMNPANYPPNAPIMYGPNGWPLGPPPPGYMMPNMGMNHMNAMNGVNPMHGMNPMGGMPMNMPPNGMPMNPMHPMNPYNQFMPGTPNNASLPMSAYFNPMQPATSGPLHPMNGSVPSKAVAAAANASTNDSGASNPFLSASSVLNPHLFPPANIPVPGALPGTNSMGNALPSPFGAMIPSNSNLNLSSNPNIHTRDQKQHLVQELKRLVDGVSLGSTPNSVHGGSVPATQRRMPELEVRKSRKLNKKIPYKAHKHKDRSSSRPERIPLGNAARCSNQKSYSSAESGHDDDSLHQDHHNTPSKTLSMPKHVRMNAHAQDQSDSDQVMSSQEPSVSHHNGTGHGTDRTVTGDDEESGMIPDDHNNSMVGTSSAAVTVTDNEENAGLILMEDDEDDATNTSHIGLDAAVVDALKHETAAQAKVDFGAMIDESDSEMSEEEDEDDDYFNMESDSANSSDLPDIKDQQVVLQNQFISASDGYVIKERQEKLNAFRKDPFRARLKGLRKKKAKRPHHSKTNRSHGRGHHIGDDVQELIREKKKTEKEQKTKRIMAILKGLRKTPHGIEDLIMSSGDEQANRDDDAVRMPNNKGASGHSRHSTQHDEQFPGRTQRAKHGDFNEREMQFLALVAKESVKESNDQKAGKRLALSNSKSMGHRTIPHHPQPHWAYAQPPPGFPQRSRQLGPYQGPPLSHSHRPYGPYSMHGPPPQHPHGPQSRHNYFHRTPLAPLDHVDEVPAERLPATPTVMSPPACDSPRSDPTPSSPKRAHIRVEGLADSGPNCPVDRMQDMIRLRQLMDKQNSNKFSTSETKSSAENNRRKLNEKLAKMGAEDEEEMLNDELFVETARLLKEDSLRRKQNAQKKSQQSQGSTPFITSDGQNNPIPPLPHRGRDNDETEASRRPTLQYFRSCGPPDQHHHHYPYYQQYGHHHPSSRGHYGAYYGHPPGFGPVQGHHRQQMLAQQPHSAHPADSDHYHPSNAYRDRRDHFNRSLPLRELPDEDHPDAAGMAKDRQRGDGDDSGLLTYLGAFEPSQEEEAQSEKPALSLYHKSSPADFLCPPRPTPYSGDRHKRGRGGPGPSGRAPPPILAEHPDVVGNGHDSGRRNAFLKAYAAHFDAVSAVTPIAHNDEEREHRGHPGPKPAVDPHASSNPVSLQQQPVRRQMVNTKMRVHHEMTLSPPENQETTNSSGSTGSDDVDSEMEELQHRQHPHQSLNDSYSYHPFSRGDDDQKKVETESESPSMRQKKKRSKNKTNTREMSSSESEVIGVPIPVADTMDDIDDEWVCSDYDGNDIDSNQSPNRFENASHLRTPLPRKSNDRRRVQQRAKWRNNTPIQVSGAESDEKAEEVFPVRRVRRKPPSPPKVNYKRGNAFGTMDCHKFPDTKSVATKAPTKVPIKAPTKAPTKQNKAVKPRPNPNRPTKPPLKLSKAARSSMRVEAQPFKPSPKQTHNSPPKQPKPSPKLVDRASKPLEETKSKLEDRASTNIDSDVATLSLSQSRTSCKAPDNEYDQQRPRRNKKPKSAGKQKEQRPRRKKNWHKKERQHAGSGLSLDAKNFVPQNGQTSSQPNANQRVYAQYDAPQSTPNSVAFSLPFMSSVPMQGATPTAAALGSVPLATPPALNRALTGPPLGSGPNNNTQLKQLENTVEQLKSHFVQLLQHLPLTPGQQNDFRHQPQIAQFLSGPNPTSTSMPNATLTSAPNVALGNVSASNLLNTSGANVVLPKPSKPAVVRSRGQTGSGGKLNSSAATFRPQASSPTQYRFPSAAAVGSLPLRGTPLFANPAMAALTPRAMTPTNPLMMAPATAAMRFQHSDPTNNRGRSRPLKQHHQ